MFAEIWTWTIIMCFIQCNRNKCTSFPGRNTFVMCNWFYVSQHKVIVLCTRLTVACSSVGDRDATILGSGTRSNKVQRYVYNCCSCLNECYRCENGYKNEQFGAALTQAELLEPTQSMLRRSPIDVGELQRRETACDLLRNSNKVGKTGYLRKFNETEWFLE
jgi:hypothetical protein